MWRAAAQWQQYVTQQSTNSLAASALTMLNNIIGSINIKTAISINA